MEITEVRIILANEKNEKMVRGFASSTIDNCLVIEHVRILNGPNGLFLAMPSRKLPNGTYKDLVHPVNAETRAMIEEKVLGEYQRVVGKGIPAVPSRQA